MFEKGKNFDLTTSTDTFARAFYRRISGGLEPPDMETAYKACRRFDQAIVSDGHPEMYGRSETGDVFKALDPSRHGEDFVDPDQIANAIAYKGKDRFHEAAEYTEKAMELRRQAQELARSDPAKSSQLMKESYEMMKESERSGHEGLRQMYKQFENILNPRDIVAQTRGKASAISQEMREMHALVKKCVEDGLPYPTLQKIFRNQYGMTVEAFADATGRLAKTIKMN